MGKRISLQEMENNIVFNDQHQVIYKGVNLGITRESITDYQIQTGFDPVEWVDHLYNNSLLVIRDKKISKILDELT